MEGEYNMVVMCVNVQSWTIGELKLIKANHRITIAIKIGLSKAKRSHQIQPFGRVLEKAQVLWKKTYNLSRHIEYSMVAYP